LSGPLCKRNLKLNDARSDEFECRNGQCIEMDARCNGIEECTDKSDETEELCLNTDCPVYTYKCRYGACVDTHSPRVKELLVLFRILDVDPPSSKLRYFTVTHRTLYSVIFSTLT